MRNIAVLIHHITSADGKRVKALYYLSSPIEYKISDDTKSYTQFLLLEETIVDDVPVLEILPSDRNGNILEGPITDPIKGLVSPATEFEKLGYWLYNDFIDIPEDEVPKILKALRELEDIYKKYNLRIKACGCCGSPWIESDSDVYLRNIDELSYEEAEWLVNNGNQATIGVRNGKSMHIP